jgi:hypothetical protein
MNAWRKRGREKLREREGKKKENETENTERARGKERDTHKTDRSSPVYFVVSLDNAGSGYSVRHLKLAFRCCAEAGNTSELMLTLPP